MIKVEIAGMKEAPEVLPGQVRYNDEGLYVLIIKGRKLGTFSSIVVSENTLVHKFDSDMDDESSSSVSSAYPYLARASLKISN